MAISARFALYGGKRSPLASEKTEKRALTGFALTGGKQLGECRLDVLVAERERFERSRDARGAPTPTIGSLAREITRESDIVQIASVPKKIDRFDDLFFGIAGASHLTGELAFAMGAAREPSQRKVARFGLGAFGGGLDRIIR